MTRAPLPVAVLALAALLLGLGGLGDHARGRGDQLELDVGRLHRPGLRPRRGRSPGCAHSVRWSSVSSERLADQVTTTGASTAWRDHDVLRRDRRRALAAAPDVVVPEVMLTVSVSGDTVPGAGRGGDGAQVERDRDVRATGRGCDGRRDDDVGLGARPGRLGQHRLGGAVVPCFFFFLPFLPVRSAVPASAVGPAAGARWLVADLARRPGWPSASATSLPSHEPPRTRASTTTSSSGDAEHDQASGPVDPGRERATGSYGRRHAVRLGSERDSSRRRRTGCTYDRRDDADLHDAVLDWYDDHARDLPWRGPDASPWSVMVSEFMLQQTPVARVLPVHAAWLERWPTPAALAGRHHRRGRADVGPARLSAARAAPARGGHGASSSATTARCRRRTTTCSRCPGSATTPPRRSPASPSVSGTSCSTPTCAGSWRGRSAGASSRRLPSPAPSATWPTSLLPDDAATAATWAVATMELGALVCTARHAALRRLSHRGGLRVARRRLPGVRRSAPARAGLGRHRPPVPRPADGRAPRVAGPVTAARLDGRLDGRGQRERCLVAWWPTASSPTSAPGVGPALNSRRSRP